MNGAKATIRQTDVEGKIYNLMGQLAKLTPHPDHPDYHGPLFIDGTLNFNPSAEYNDIAKMSFLSAMFTNATAGNNNINWKNAAICNRTTPENMVKISLSQTNVIKAAFNQSALRNAMIKAFQADLSLRLNIEGQISYYLRKLYTLRKNELVWYIPYAA